MAKSDEAVLVSYLAGALKEPLGLGTRHEYLSMSDANLVRQKLYAIRRAHPEYRALSFRVVDCVLMILHMGHEDPLT